MESAVKTIFTELLDSIGIPYTEVRRSELAGQVIFSVDTQTQAGNLSDLVHALDYLVKKIAEKRAPGEAAENAEGKHSDISAQVGRQMFLIDVNDHRIKQIKDLQTKAIMMAERARSFQYDVELTPMSSYERLIVHTTLQDAPNVKTESQGEGRNRRVVIKYSA